MPNSFGTITEIGTLNDNAFTGCTVRRLLKNIKMFRLRINVTFNVEFTVVEKENEETFSSFVLRYSIKKYLEKL